MSLIHESLELETVDSLNEASTSRLVNKFLDDSVTFAIISASRSEKSPQENNKLTQQLKADVRQANLGFNEFIGRWVEDGESSDEASLLITGISKKLACKLGAKYEQASIIYKDGSGVNEICTTAFTDDGKTYNPGDVVRKYSIDPNKPLNTAMAQEIFSNKVGGPASLLKKGSNRKPFNFTLDESFELYEKKLTNTRLGYTTYKINLEN